MKYGLAARLPIALLCSGCGNAGGSHLALPLRTQGSAPEAVEIRGGTITLSEAEVAIGPLYLCASESPDAELCESAVAEWLSAAAIDALDDAPVEQGLLRAVNGSVRSGQYDYGLHWLITHPSVTPGDESIDGHSARLAGLARGDDGSELSFEALLDVAPIARGGSAAQLRTQEHTLEIGEALTLHVDPNGWLSRIRYDELLALDADDGDGHVQIMPGTQPYEAIVQAMVSVSGVLELTWGPAER